MSDGPKHPYREALEAAEAFKALFPPACYSAWEFAGSLRRHRSEVGDLDHVVVPNFGDIVAGNTLFAVPERANLLWHHLNAMVKGHVVDKDLRGGAGPCWGEKHRSIRHGKYKHEIYLADVDNWGSVLAIRTGPGEFSRMLVTQLAAGGVYRQQDGYVVDRDGQRVPVPTEEDYFRVCGVTYQKPHTRDVGSFAKVLGMSGR